MNKEENGHWVTKGSFDNHLWDSYRNLQQNNSHEMKKSHLGVFKVESIGFSDWLNMGDKKKSWKSQHQWVNWNDKVDGSTILR